MRVDFLLKGIVFGNDGRALSPFHSTKKGGRCYRYYIPQRDVKEYAGASGLPRMPAAELESAVLEQLRGFLRSPELLAMLESGQVSSLPEIAAQEGVDNSYVSRMMNLTVLAPDIVDAILDDTLPDHLTLFDIAVDPSTLWEGQRAWVSCDHLI